MSSIIDKRFAKQVLTALESSGTNIGTLSEQLSDLTPQELDEFFVRAGDRMGLSFEPDDKADAERVLRYREMNRERGTAEQVLKGFTTGVADAATLGNAAEYKTAVEQLGPGTGQPELGGSVLPSEEALQFNKQEVARAKREAPVSSFLGELTTWFLPGTAQNVFGKAGLKAAGAINGTGLLAKAAQGAVAGAVSGGLDIASRQIKPILSGEETLGEAATTAATGAATGAIAGGALSGALQAVPRAAQLVSGGLKKALYKFKGKQIDLSKDLDSTVTFLNDLKASSDEAVTELQSTMSEEAALAKGQIDDTINQFQTKLQNDIQSGKPKDYIKTLQNFARVMQSVDEGASGIYDDIIQGALKENAGQKLALTYDDPAIRDLLERGAAIKTEAGLKLVPENIGGISGSEANALETKLNELLNPAEGLSWFKTNELKKAVGRISDHRGDAMTSMYQNLRDKLVASDKSGQFDQLSSEYSEFLKIFAPIRKKLDQAAAGQYENLGGLMQSALAKASKQGQSRTGMEQSISLLGEIPRFKPLFDSGVQTEVANTFDAMRRQYAAVKYPTRASMNGLMAKAAKTGQLDDALLQQYASADAEAKSIGELLAKANLPAKVKDAVKYPFNKELKESASNYISKNLPSAKIRFEQLHNAAARQQRIAKLGSSRKDIVEFLDRVGDLPPEDQTAIRVMYDFVPDFGKLLDNAKVVKQLDPQVKKSLALMGFETLVDAGDFLGIVPDRVADGLRVINFYLMAKTNPQQLYNVLSSVNAKSGAAAVNLANYATQISSRLAPLYNKPQSETR